MPAAPDLVPRRVRAAFAHAAVQQAATRIGVRVLHIKGVAVDDDLRSSGGATDADILVDPSEVGLLLAELTALGWDRYSDFVTGSPFGHAATVHHPHWGYADLHRFFPGMHQDPVATFEELWAGRQVAEIGGMPCPVPSAAGQVLVLVLNNLRNRRTVVEDPRVAQVRADPAAWQQVEALVHRVHAEVAFDAALGRLEEHRGEREYWMWKVTTEGGSRSAEWLARVRAEPTLRGRAGLLVRVPLVNTEVLGHQLGRPPTRAEVAREFVHRGVRGVGELRAVLVRRIRRGSP
ncbi:nucleotidyltransferase family protein [Ornithinimicrobium sp. F0845]|uniref:nucleotidyltransferase family protein n=1 Tax=Ornithinimicrobium sp. F0845 TaxID=2926412 RepID=UPI001FF1EF17|nr:nucleotidyltransferase family protein [Ornithinimicrobium sp. F0845]MCK0112234.1 nucleotidyltransferase family protein [Ornithinimicrobium sp. F0845]